MRPAALTYALLGAAIQVALAAPQGSDPEDTTVDNGGDFEEATTTNGTINVGFGQQLQAEDEANHWVVWEEGKKACSLAQVLGPLIEDPCSQAFTLPGSVGDQLTFGDCDEAGFPNALFTGGSFLKTCKKHKHTIHCHSDLKHNIIKHGKCVN